MIVIRVEDEHARALVAWYASFYHLISQESVTIARQHDFKISSSLGSIINKLSKNA